MVVILSHDVMPNSGFHGKEKCKVVMLLFEKSCVGVEGNA